MCDVSVSLLVMEKEDEVNPEREPERERNLASLRLMEHPSNKKSWIVSSSSLA
jgi:hypothetical protein